jgi:enamine deaminase RidA (YjgF/YER057c/UK114 family)
VGLEEDGGISADASRQARRAFEIIEAALRALGSSLDDVIRTRIFVTDISQWQAIGRVHGEVLGHVMPATTMVEVRRLIDDRCVVEIEADALVTSRR